MRKKRWTRNERGVARDYWGVLGMQGLGFRGKFRGRGEGVDEWSKYDLLALKMLSSVW